MSVTLGCKHGNSEPMKCVQCFEEAVKKQLAFNATQVNAGNPQRGW